MPRCAVRVRNATSPVRVNGFTVTFSFKDGSPRQYTKRNRRRLGPGASAWVIANRGDWQRCVVHTTTRITVGDTPVTKPDGVPPGACQGGLGWKVDATGISPGFAPEKEAPKAQWPALMPSIDVTPDPVENEEIPDVDESEEVPPEATD